MVLSAKFKKKLKNFILDVDFSAEAGCMGILGASGSGKSMTLKCIAGIERPDEGIIILNDRVLFDSDRGINCRPQERRIGYLFQNYALFPNMTVAENIAVGRQIRYPHSDQKEIAQQVDRVIRRFHLNGHEHTYPKNLSGGEQQRTAMARMLMSEPEVLLLDEPFSALDSYLKEELQAELNKVMKEFGGVCILVTHSRDEVYKLSDTLLIMENGRGLQHGNTKKLFQSPETYAGARLTGCKNISPIIEKQDGTRYAQKWNLPIPTTDAGYHYVGIRAHDFKVVCPEKFTERGSEYIMNIHVQEITEAPFEWNIMFTVDEAAEESNRMWWKVSKDCIPSRETIETVTMLQIRPESLLLLK